MVLSALSIWARSCVEIHLEKLDYLLFVDIIYYEFRAVAF